MSDIIQGKDRHPSFKICQARLSSIHILWHCNALNIIPCLSIAFAMKRSFIWIWIQKLLNVLINRYVVLINTLFINVIFLKTTYLLRPRLSKKCIFPIFTSNQLNQISFWCGSGKVIKVVNVMFELLYLESFNKFVSTIDRHELSGMSISVLWPLDVNVWHEEYIQRIYTYLYHFYIIYIRGNGFQTLNTAWNPS